MASPEPSHLAAPLVSPLLSMDEDERRAEIERQVAAALSAFSVDDDEFDT